MLCGLQIADCGLRVADCSEPEDAPHAGGSMEARLLLPTGDKFAIRNPQSAIEARWRLRRSVRLDQPIAQPYDSPRVACNIFLVCDHDQRVALGVEVLEKIHDLDPRFGIQVSGGFVGKDN